MWSVLKDNPIRTLVTIAYLACVAVFLAVTFSPADARDKASGSLFIPAADISVAVTPSSLKDGQFYVPDYVVGAYTRDRKTFLMGHSTSAFANLWRTSLGDDIFYSGQRYRVIHIKEQNLKDVSMKEVLQNTQSDSLILMTCAGENDSRRLIVTAVKIQ